MTPGQRELLVRGDGVVHDPRGALSRAAQRRLLRVRLAGAELGNRGQASAEEGSDGEGGNCYAHEGKLGQTGAARKARAALSSFVHALCVGTVFRRRDPASAAHGLDVVGQLLAGRPLIVVGLAVGPGVDVVDLPGT